MRRVIAAVLVGLGTLACGSDTATGPSVDDPRGSWSGTFGPAGSYSAGTTLTVSVQSGGGYAVVGGRQTPFTVTQIDGRTFLLGNTVPTTDQPDYVVEIRCTVTDAHTCDGTIDFATARSGSGPIHLTR